MARPKRVGAYLRQVGKVGEIVNLYKDGDDKFTVVKFGTDIIECYADRLDLIKSESKLLIWLRS